MKRKLLLLLCSVLTSVSMWAYTSVAPESVRAYYLYNVGKGTYWYGADHNIGSGNTRYTGHTSSLYDATPTRVRISGDNYTFTYYVNGVEYQIRHTADNGEAVLTGGSANFQLYDKTDNKYTIEFKSDKQRRMHAEDGGTCDYDKNLSADNNTLHWRFYAYEEILPDLVTHNASTCASTAASYVSGWERVTTKEQLAQNPERYFYAIFSAVNPGVMMTTELNDNQYRMCYKAAGNPLSSSSYDLFEMENYDGEFAIKSNVTGKYYGNTSNNPWNFIADQETLNEKCKVTVTCNNGVYNLQDKYEDGNAWQDEFVGNYLGAWDNMEFVGERLAGNKGLKRAGYFLIYRKLKKDLDMTSRISNPSFEAEDMSAWSCSTDNDTGRKQNTGNYAMTNGNGSYLFNTWDNGNANPVSQTLSNMPAGYYTLTAVMASDDTQTLRLKVGEGVVATSTATGAANGIEMGGSFQFAGGNMTISADANGHWYKVDNFRLTCIGGMEDLTLVSGKMKTTVNENQISKVATYNSNKTLANYNAAIDAIAAAEASKTAYANAASYLEKVEALLATTNFYTSTAYNSVYGTYKTAYDAGTMEDATASGLSYKTPSYTPADARYTSNTANDLLIPGWTIGETTASTTDSKFYINTWSTESEGTGDAKDFANPFYEYWVDNGSVLGATTITGTLSGMTPNAFYSVTANVRVRQTDGQTKAANSITMKVGNGTSVDVTQGNQIGSYKRYIKSYTAIGAADGDGNLTLTFTVAENSNISWLSFRDVNYDYLGNTSAVMAVNSTAKWGTFCAPFDVAIPADVDAYTCSEVKDGVLTLTPVETTISANTPVILNAESGLESTTFYGVREGSSDIVNVGLLYGNVSASAQNVPSDGTAYLLQLINDKVGFYKVSESGYMIGINRCYLVSEVALAREAFLLEGEGETAINEIEAVEAKAEGLKDGKYLINGRIVIVKDGKTLSISGQILK